MYARARSAFHDPSWSKATCQHYVLYPEVLKIFTATVVGRAYPDLRASRRSPSRVLTSALASYSNLHSTIILYIFQEEHHPIRLRGSPRRRARCQNRASPFSLSSPLGLLPCPALPTADPPITVGIHRWGHAPAPTRWVAFKRFCALSVWFFSHCLPAGFVGCILTGRSSP